MKFLTKEVQIALVAIFGLVILFFGMKFLKGLSIMSEGNTYMVKFSDVSGLSASSPIYVNGVKVGTVESILIWIRARYKVIGEVSVYNADPWCPHFIFTRIVDPSYWYYKTETEAKRFLVEVEGVEKLFKLEPFPAGLLPWYRSGAVDGGAAGQESREASSSKK